MSLSIDLKNAVDKRANNFTCLLFQLMFKSDINNFSKLATTYPIESNMVLLYRSDCSYNENSSDVDFEKIEQRARELNVNTAK